jgi:hypothetical protein
MIFKNSFAGKNGDKLSSCTQITAF